MEDKILRILESIKNHTENYEDVKKIIFTNTMLNKEYSLDEEKLIMKNFLKLKSYSIYALKNDLKMTFYEAFVLYRLLLNECRIKEDTLITFNEIFVEMDILKYDLKENGHKRCIKFPLEYFKMIIKNMILKENKEKKIRFESI